MWWLRFDQRYGTKGWGNTLSCAPPCHRCGKGRAKPPTCRAPSPASLAPGPHRQPCPTLSRVGVRWHTLSCTHELTHDKDFFSCARELAHSKEFQCHVPCFYRVPTSWAHDKDFVYRVPCYYRVPFGWPTESCFCRVLDKCHTAKVVTRGNRVLFHSACGSMWFRSMLFQTKTNKT